MTEHGSIDHRGGALRELGQHLRGERVGDVEHMCPECGLERRVFCPTCYGLGLVTTSQLHVWQAQHPC